MTPDPADPHLGRVFAPVVRDDKSGVPPRVLERKRRLRPLIATWVVVLQLPLLAALPRPDGYVNDFASVLDEASETYLETFLQTLERETSAEVVVATVTSLEGMAAEEYASRLFAEWGIGKKRHDNGVLVLVAPADRTVRIEVGYGLESVLTDGLAGEIIRAEILPEFKIGNYPRGIGRGLNRIAQVVRGDPAAAAWSASSGDDGTDFPPALLMVPFFGLFVVPAAFAAGLGIRTRTYVPLITGSLLAGFPLLMMAVFASASSIAILVALGLAALAIGYRKGQSAYWTGMLRKGSPGSVRGEGPVAWEMGGASGSSAGDASDGAGSSSGGDFGGGSSGGGGATGHW